MLLARHYNVLNQDQKLQVTKMFYVTCNDPVTTEQAFRTMLLTEPELSRLLEEDETMVTSSGNLSFAHQGAVSTSKNPAAASPAQLSPIYQSPAPPQSLEKGRLRNSRLCPYVPADSLLATSGWLPVSRRRAKPSGRN
eukprot:GHVS01080610.1.p1 GENE.GHVS01080610.1~~GHVS01080610.1.p1  ORF type:complete len:138 (+),score=7.45 GHVS01080610.1:91-504(+)